MTIDVSGPNLTFPQSVLCWGSVRTSKSDTLCFCKRLSLHRADALPDAGQTGNFVPEGSMKAEEQIFKKQIAKDGFYISIDCSRGLCPTPVRSYVWHPSNLRNHLVNTTHHER